MVIIAKIVIIITKASIANKLCKIAIITITTLIAIITWIIIKIIIAIIAIKTYFKASQLIIKYYYVKHKVTLNING